MTICECGCCHSVDHGACPTFEAGMNGRCVYCDHGQPCHGKNVGPWFNGPLGRTGPCDDCGGPTRDAVDHRGKPRPLCKPCQHIATLGTLNLTILTGEPFDWTAAKRHSDAYMAAGRELAAMFATDPGTVRCPECRVRHWREGTCVRCTNPDCNHEWTIE